MSDTAPRLVDVDMPPAPGKRVTLVVPAGNEMVTRAEPLLPGAGFTLNFGGYGMWRAELRIASWVGDEVGMELEITGRYAEAPQASSRRREDGADWDDEEVDW